LGGEYFGSSAKTSIPRVFINNKIKDAVIFLIRIGAPFFLKVLESFLLLRDQDLTELFPTTWKKSYGIWMENFPSKVANDLNLKYL
jgi:hypothetical protein